MAITMPMNRPVTATTGTLLTPTAWKTGTRIRKLARCRNAQAMALPEKMARSPKAETTSYKASIRLPDPPGVARSTVAISHALTFHGSSRYPTSVPPAAVPDAIDCAEARERDRHAAGDAYSGPAP